MSCLELLYFFFKSSAEKKNKGAVEKTGRAKIGGEARAIYFSLSYEEIYSLFSERRPEMFAF